MAKPMKLLGDDEDKATEERERLELARWLLRDAALRSCVAQGIITPRQYLWATTSDDTPDN